MSDTNFESQLKDIAMQMEYPRTPDIAGSVNTRLRFSTNPRFAFKRIAWSLTMILIIFSSLILIPPARAAILEFIQIGVVRIFPPRSISTSLPWAETPIRNIPVTVAPQPTSQALIPILEQLYGETSLGDAQKLASYPILLPTHPSDLGKPDRVFVQDANGYMTILIWLDPQKPDRIAMSLHFIPLDSWAVRKVEPVVVQETKVNDQRAIWAEGPYVLRLRNGSLEFTRMIEGHVLIWAVGDITYRLETDLTLDEALKIAESLQPIQ